MGARRLTSGAVEAKGNAMAANRQSLQGRRPRVSLTAAVLLALVGAFLAVIAVVFVHALLSPEFSAASWTGGSRVLSLMVILGAAGTGALTAILMGLAFYSDRKGYDEPPHVDPPSES